MKPLRVKILNQGKLIQTIDLSAQSFQIKATKYTDYVLEDQATGQAPKNVKVKRDGNDLVIRGDDESQYLVIKDYYTTDKVALIGESNGQMYAYDIAENQQVLEVADLANQQTSLQSLGENPIHHTWWSASASNVKTLGLVGLGIAGIAAIANGKDDSDGSQSDNNTNVTPLPTPTNHAPTGINLNNTNVSENNAGAIIGTLTTTDPDANDTFTYSVNDNRFEIVNGQLKLKDGIALDYEATPNIAVTVTSTDQGNLSTQQTFNITVADINENPIPPVNQAPTGINLNNTNVSENNAGAIIGTLTTTDPDANDTFTYSVNDNRFEIVNGQLKLKDGIALDYEATPNVAVTVTSTDQGNLSTTKDFTIAVSDVNEVVTHAPSDIALSSNTLNETMAGVVIGTLTTTDPDANDTFTYSVNDSRFEIVNGQLKLKGDVFLDYEATPTINLTITSTDQTGLSTNKTFTINVNDIDETGYIYGDGLSNIINGTDNADVLIGLKGNDILNGGANDDTYVFYKGDGQDVINEQNTFNALEFNDVNSQDVTIERYKENITLHYTEADSVTFNVNTINKISFKDTIWSGNMMADNLGVFYWERALTQTDIDTTFIADKDDNRVLYFSFPTTNPNPDDATIQGWAPFTDAQKEIARTTFHNLEAFLPLTFVEVTSNTIEPDTIYLQNNTQFEQGVLGLGGPNNWGGGNIWLSSTTINDELRYTIAHEIGHVLGLDHPINYENDPNKIYELPNGKEDSSLWTIMTYNVLQDQPIPTDYQELDIASLQYLYGVNPNARTGNDTYSFDNSTGTFVWDGAGIDSISASNATESAYIDLHDGSWSYIGTKSTSISDPNQLTINSSTKIENAIGGNANDTLRGNELNNLLQGNAGDDTLTGYQGADTIVFTSVLADNTGGNGHDTFTDFHLGNTLTDTQADKIDLSQLLVGYTGDKSAPSLAGYVEVTQQNGNTVLAIDRDGTGVAYTKAELLTLNSITVNLDQLLANNQLII